MARLRPEHTPIRFLLPGGSFQGYASQPSALNQFPEKGHLCLKCHQVENFAEDQMGTQFALGANGQL